VIRLTPHTAPWIGEGEVPGFRRFVVGLFGFRRKQLGRGLRQLTGATTESVARWLGAAGVDETARPETLTPEAFVRLFRAVEPGATKAPVG
jgi:16S rRNA A1518/A1519 N6-dimethyltransferase RsmA/KsgA/DIM1 with predicted DNA glycosylase/AP lyase activity